MSEKNDLFPTILPIGETLVSLDIIEKKFICNLHACKGGCCVDGDSGAPLETEELSLLKKHYRKIKPFLTEEGRKAIHQQGLYVLDVEGDKTTPLVDKKHCAYVVFEKGIASCGIEKAYEAGAIDWQKPLSCHLYPIRIKKYPDFSAVNYHQWEICEPARILGEQQGVPIYQFLKAPLIRKFGSEWYETLNEIAGEYLKHKGEGA